MINLKEIRKSCGLNQQEIAERLGITQQQYSRYETNTNKISLDMFLKILDICNYKITLQKNDETEKK